MSYDPIPLLDLEGPVRDHSRRNRTAHAGRRGYTVVYWWPTPRRI